MFLINDNSHTDHHLTAGHVGLMHALFGDRSGFFIETVELPPELPELPNGIYGPSCGDDPVGDESFIAIRVGRPWPSRMVDRPVRTSRLMTVIAGPTEDHPEDSVLYTAFGGPKAEKEPGDFSLGMVCEDHRELWKAAVNRTFDYSVQVGQLQHSLMAGCQACSKAMDELIKSLEFWDQHALSIHDCELVKNSTDERLRNLRSKGGLYRSVAFPGDRATFTCDTCEENLSCPWAYNPFCVDGHCLPKALVPPEL